MSVLDFAEVTSACTVMPVAVRLDPYWSGVWEQGSSAAWLSANLARRQEASGLGKIPSHLAYAEGQLLESLGISHRVDSRLSAMGAIDVWRTLTGEQLAAFTGDTKLASPTSKSLGELFAAGIADIGLFNTGLSYGKGAGAIYRPARTNTFDREIAPHLTYPEWVSVTGGYPWESGSQFDRHNILAAELALRVAEWCEIGAVVGEKLSSWDLLAHGGAGFEAPVGAQHAADATLIRTDGMRIAVELTASTGLSFKAKVRRWATLLANRRMADTGLVVIFVVATRPDKMVNSGEVTNFVRRVVASAARDNPGVNFDRTASRMLVADWRDWFPGAKRVDRSFLSLECQRPTGPAGDPWETAFLLDPFDVVFEPKDEARSLAVIDNLSALRAVPSWLRNGRAPELWPLAVKEAGFAGIPVPLPSRPESHIGVPLGAPVGASGQTKPPRRLRINRSAGER